MNNRQNEIKNLILDLKNVDVAENNVDILQEFTEENNNMKLGFLSSYSSHEILKGLNVLNENYQDLIREMTRGGNKYSNFLVSLRELKPKSDFSDDPFL